MLDIKFICDNPELVKENIKRKFKDNKLPLVDELIALYTEKCAANTKANDLSKALKEKCTLPLISKMADSKKQLSEDAFTLLKEDIFASDLYNIVLSHKFEKDFVSDYQKQIQIL